jgi:uncharacterized protein (TIGR02217 family)
MHLAMFLPEEIELGAVQRHRYSTDVVSTDGGYEKRRYRWSTPLREMEVSFAIAERDDPIYVAVRALFDASLGGAHSFNFRDWADESGETVLAVRFDSALEITGVTPELDHIASVTLVEVRR